MYTMGTVLRHGSEAQKKAYLPSIANGPLRLQAFGVTEPTSGTDTLALKTTARRDGDRLHRQWPENLDFAGGIFRSDVAARPHDAARAGEEQDRRLVRLLVDLRELVGNGITIRPIRTMINHSTTEVFFDNVRSARVFLIGEEGKGFRYILSGMNAERILIAAECVGDAKWFLEKGADYAKDRVIFGAPIGKNQGVQFPLARAFAHMLAAEAIVYQRGRPLRCR